MKRAIAVPLLVAIPLAIAGCGGSSATPQTAAGVKSDYVQFAKLVSAGNGATACSRYISPTVVAELSAVGGCAKLIDYEVAKQGGLNASTVTNGWTATVTGTTGTYRTATASGTAVYVDGHWMFAADSSTTSSSAQSGTNDDAAAKELVHSAQVAAETIATDNGGSYALVTPALLNTYESTIQVGSTPAGNAYIANVNTTGGAVGTSTTYTVTATSTTGDTYSIIRSASGTIARTCIPVGQGGCSSAGGW